MNMTNKNRTAVSRTLTLIITLSFRNGRQKPKKKVEVKIYEKRKPDRRGQKRNCAGY